MKTLTCVCAYVSLEQPGPGEGLAAELTHTGQRVSPDVHLESPQAAVLFLTVLTAEALLVAPLTVELLVSRQARGAQALFTAVQALKVLTAAAAWRDGRKERQDRDGRGQQALCPPGLVCDTLDFQIHFGKGVFWFVGTFRASTVIL